MFPCRYGRRNSMKHVKHAPHTHMFVHPFLVGGVVWGVCCFRLCIVDAVFGTNPVGLVWGTINVCCAQLYGWQALGLLVPVGWALLLYTSGLSTQWSVGGLNPSRGWETLS